MIWRLKATQKQEAFAKSLYSNANTAGFSHDILRNVDVICTVKFLRKIWVQRFLVLCDAEKQNSRWFLHTLRAIWLLTPVLRREN